MISKLTTNKSLSQNRLFSSLCFILFLSLFTGHYGQAQILQFPLHGNPHKCQMQASLDDLSLFCGGNQICITVTGGEAPYTVFLNHNLVETDDEAAELQLCFTDLAPGKYKLRIRDAKGCNAKLRFFIPEEVLQASVTPVHCGADDNGAITVKVPFDLDNLEFNWTGSGGFSAQGKTITGLTAGTYSVEVTTQIGTCVAQGSWTVEAQDPVSIEAITDDKQDEACPTSTNTCLSIKGGSGQYRVWVYNEIPEVLAEVSSGQIADFDIQLKGGKKYHPKGEDDQLCMDNVPTGTYQILVVDQQGCFTWATVEIINPVFRMRAKGDHLGCNDEDGLGKICYRLQGGTPPYSVTLQIDGEPTSVEAKDCFDGLPAGEYTLVATDSEGCTIEKIVRIKAAEPLEAHFELTGNACDNRISGCVRVKGGQGPYRFFAWAMEEAPEDLPQITINDEGWPEIEGLETLTFPFDDEGEHDEEGDEVEDDEDDDNSGVGARRCVQALPAGYYLLLVIDGNGCRTTLEIDIPQTSPLKVEAEATQPTEDQADGTITLHISGGQAPYKVAVNGGEASEHDETEVVLTDLSAGKYHVEVTDAGGCTRKLRVRLGKGKESSCHGGTIEISSTTVVSGEVVSLKLIDYVGQQIRWQIKTDEHDWATLPGKLGDEIVTPALVATLEQTVYIRAVVKCEGNEVEFSDEVAILITVGDGLTNPQEDEAAQLVAVSPNPSQGQMQVKVKTDFPAGTIVQVRSSTGLVMYQQTTGELQAGTQLTLELNHLPSGLYYLSLENKQQRHYQRIMLQR